MRRIFIITLLVCLFLAQVLEAQTMQQKEASTALISQLLGGRFQFNAKQTRAIGAQQAKDLLDQQTNMPPNVRSEINRQLQIDRSWQGVRAAFETDCGEVEVIVSPPNEQTGQSAVYVVLPPYNRCAEAHRQLAPYIYGSEVSEDGRTNSCISQICATLPENSTGIRYQCIEIMTIIPADRICYSFEECSPKRPCTEEVSSISLNGNNWRDILLMNAE